MSAKDTGGAALLKGEGDVRIVIKTRVRRECDNCGEPATKRITYVLNNGRINPASSAYGRDDCSYCSDSDAFACDECEREVKRVCAPADMGWCSTFSARPHFSHMFLRWQEKEISEGEAIAMLAARKEAT